MGQRCLSLITTVSLVLISLTAAAEDKAAAKKHFKAGLELMKSESFADAATEFETSADLYPNKNNLFNLATCYRALDRQVEALDILERVKRDFDSKLKPDMRADIDDQIAEIRTILANLSIAVAPDGATVSIDGEDMGVAPLSEPLVLRRGGHVIEVKLDNYETLTRSVTLAGGESSTESFELTELKAQLMVVSKQTDAEIMLNGDPTAKTPLESPLSVEKGSYVVAVSKDGFETMVKNVELAPGEEMSMEFDLAEIPGASQPETLPAPTEQRVSVVPQEDEPKRKRSPLLGIGLAGTIIMGGVSAGMWGAAVSNKNEHDDKNDELDPYDYNDQVANQRDAAGEDTKKYNRAAVATTAITGGFVVLTIIGAVLKASYKREAERAVSFSPSGLQVRF